MSLVQSAQIKIVRNDGNIFQIDGSEWAILKNGLDGFGDFSNDVSTVNSAYGDGGYIASHQIRPKDRTIMAKTLGKGSQELRRQVMSFFNGKDTYKIFVTYMGETRWCEGMVHKFTLPNSNVREPMMLTVTFMCANPFMRSEDDFGQDIAEIMPMLSFPYLSAMAGEDAPEGTTGGIYNFDRIIEIINDGDVETYCKVVFLASDTVVNPSFSVNGHIIKFLDELEMNDEVVMDFASMPPRVTKNGVNAIGKCDRTSEFNSVQLDIGFNEVSYDADDGSANVIVSVYYNKLYNTI